MTDADPRPRRPNVVLILSDDQGWGDLSYTGNRNLHTPRIDGLAADGAVFEWFYVQPLCAPTRAELLTGRYFPRTGVRGVTRKAEYLNLDETTIADVFREAGYATGCFGKWHSGSAYPYHPNGRGFDEFVGFCCGHWSHYFDSTLEHNGEEFRGDGFIIDVLTDRAMDFIRQHREQPFFCYVPFNTPHSPFQVPDRFFEPFADREPVMRHRDPDKENTDVTRSVLAMCENIDWNVGRLVDCLAEQGLTEDTVVIYLSDNGPNSWRWNGGMRGRKGSTDEGGVRSPFSITWPGQIEPGTRIPQIAGTIDLLPTLAELADIELDATQLDGVSLKGLLEGATSTWMDRSIFAQSADGRRTSIRTQLYRADAEGLYEIGMDAGQDRNIAANRPGVHRALTARIEAWRAEVLPTSHPDRPLPVGYPEFPVTYLPAQDAVPSGDITWSSVHPNASFFLKWHNTEDSMTWDLDVQTAGQYDVSLLYTCPERDVGAEVELRCGEQALRGFIDTPFDPPLKDGEDRVKRDESYEKEFRPLCLGSMRLDAGRNNAILKAIAMPGSMVADLRAVKLRLVSVRV